MSNVECMLVVVGMGSGAKKKVPLFCTVLLWHFPFRVTFNLSGNLLPHRPTIFYKPTYIKNIKCVLFALTYYTMFARVNYATRNDLRMLYIVSHSLLIYQIK